MELQNEELSQQLKQKCELIKCLTDDLDRIQSDRLYCMIFETYQRFRIQIGKKYDENGKIDSYLDKVKRGKIMSHDKLVHWMIKFEESQCAQVTRSKNITLFILFLGSERVQKPVLSSYYY